MNGYLCLRFAVPRVGGYEINAVDIREGRCKRWKGTMSNAEFNTLYCKDPHLDPPTLVSLLREEQVPLTEILESFWGEIS